MIAFALAAALQTRSPEPNPKHVVSTKLKLDAAFIDAHDRNHDRALDLDEFKDAMTQQLQRAAAANADSHDRLTPDTIAQWRAEILPRAFRGLDKNSDGRLTAEELRN